MRYAVVGTGAIGGYYGAMLARSGKDVEFLLHSDYEHVRCHGLRVASCNGDFSLPHVEAFRSTADMSKADVVLVGLKTTNNHLLKELLPPLLHPGSIVILIQNGIGPEADLQAMLPDVEIAAGLAFICSAKTGPGEISHQAYGHINLGNYSCSGQSVLTQVVADMREAGIKAGVTGYGEARWKKAVWNMPFNGMTVALEARTDELLANSSTRELIRAQMLEVAGAAQASGVDGIGEEFVDKMIADTLVMPPYKPSMKLDYDSHRPMEIEYIYTRPIAEARKVGFEMPRLAMLESELQFLQAQRMR